MSEFYEALSHKVATAIKEQIATKPSSCLGLPTGRTPLGTYALLDDWTKHKHVDWSGVHCFALDEYLDVDPRYSFHNYLQENLYNDINVSQASCYMPTEIVDYDEAIAKAGGLDLIILGMGTNGHIAFNEPGTPLESWTHSVWLSESTRISNSEFFGGVAHVPTRAVTMGIRTVLASRRIILMVSGKGKAHTLELALHGPVTSQIPASYLQLHNNLTVLTDFEEPD